MSGGDGGALLSTAWTYLGAGGPAGGHGGVAWHRGAEALQGRQAQAVQGVRQYGGPYAAGQEAEGKLRQAQRRGQQRVVHLWGCAKAPGQRVSIKWENMICTCIPPMDLRSRRLEPSK